MDFAYKKVSCSDKGEFGCGSKTKKASLSKVNTTGNAQENIGF